MPTILGTLQEEHFHSNHLGMIDLEFTRAYRLWERERGYQNEHFSFSPTRQLPDHIGKVNESEEIFVTRTTPDWSLQPVWQHKQIVDLAYSHNTNTKNQIQNQ